jgi:hemolysin D
LGNGCARRCKAPGCNTAAILLRLNASRAHHGGLDEGLEIEAMVANRDIGFVRPGQVAQIKIETFTFTRYGLVEAEVVHVSNDLIQDEKKGLVYAARIRLKQHVVRIDRREVALGAGMNATVEILTDRRRVIEFLLSPLLRMQHDAMRER